MPSIKTGGNEQDVAASNSAFEAAPLKSRFLAMVYDGLIILFITTVVVLIIQVTLIGDNVLAPDHIMNKLLKPLWFVPGFFYLGYYWTKNGQTPSMKVWKIKLLNQQGHLITWSQAFSRYCAALMGLGIVLALFNKKRLSLQDMLSKSSLIKVPD